MEKYNIIIVELDEVLITPFSDKLYPRIWDYKINWKVWKYLKKLSPKKVRIISNQGGIKRGFIKDAAFYSKISFISYSLEDYLRIDDIKFKYSICGNWREGLSEESDSLIDLLIPKKSQNVLVIGNNNVLKIDSELRGFHYLDINNLI